MVDNGAFANPISGSIGNPATVADDVVVDGKFITAENFESATYFGEVIASEVYAEIAKDNGPFVVSGGQLLVQGTNQNDVIYVWNGRGGTVLAWLNGHQSHFTMVGGMQSARSVAHYADLFRLAAAANLLADPDLAARRMRALAALHGID